MAAKVVHANDSGVVELKYNPYQVEFFNARRLRNPDGTRQYKRFALFAGRRSGKTRAGAVACVEEATVPKTTHWACAPTYPDLHDFVLPALRMTLPTQWIKDWSEANYEFRLTNDSLIQCRSLDDPEKARGPGLHSLWIDEARKIQQKAWDTARPALTEHRGAAFLTTSPNGFDWVHKRFWKPAVQGKPGFWAIKYKTIDNPIITAEEVQEAREEMDPQFFAQEYEGEFVHFTGSIYGGLLESQILRSDAEIRQVMPEWPKFDPSRMCYCPIDPGTDHPFAAVLLIVTEFGVVCAGEYLQRYSTIDDHVLGIQRMLRGMQPKYAYDKTAPQTAIELTQYGIHAVPSESDVMVGIRRVQSWLRTKRLFFIEKLCPQTVEQMQGLHWKDTNRKSGELGQEGQFKFDDDLPDCVRYGLMLHPELPTMKKLVSGRNISTFPEGVRWAIERMRRCDNPDQYNELEEMDPLELMDGALSSPTEEFWTH